MVAGEERSEGDGEERHKRAGRRLPVCHKIQPKPRISTKEREGGGVLKACRCWGKVAKLKIGKGR